MVKKGAKKTNSGSEHHVHHHLPQGLQVLVVIVGVIIAIAGLKFIQGTGTVGKAFGMGPPQEEFVPYYDPSTGEYVDMPDDTMLDPSTEGSPIDDCIFDCWEGIVEIPDRWDCSPDGLVKDCNDPGSCDPLILGPACQVHNEQVDEKFKQQTETAEQVCPDRCIPNCADAAEQLNYNKGECNTNKPGPGWSQVTISEPLHSYKPTCPEGKTCFGARDVCELGDVREGFIDQEKYENPDCLFSTPESPDRGGFWKEFGKADCKYEGRSQTAGTCMAWKPTCTREAIEAVDPDAFDHTHPWDEARCVERDDLISGLLSRGYSQDNVEAVFTHFYINAYDALKASMDRKVLYEAVKCDPKPGILGTHECFLEIKQQCACKRDGSPNGIDCNARNNGNQKSMARCMKSTDLQRRLSDGNFRPHTMGVGYCAQWYEADFVVSCIQYLLDDCSLGGLTEQERTQYESVICATSPEVQQGLTDEEFGQQYEVISRIDCDERPERGRGDYNKRCFAKKISSDTAGEAGSEQGAEGATGATGSTGGTGSSGACSGSSCTVNGRSGLCQVNPVSSSGACACFAGDLMGSC